MRKKSWIYKDAKAYMETLSGDPEVAIISLQLAAEARDVSRAAIDRMLRLGQLDEVKIGRTRWVRAKSLIALEVERERKIELVRDYLEDCARQKKVITYKPVMAVLGLLTTVPAHRTTIGAILGAISEQTWEQDKILLSVIVHRKALGKTRPGPGFLSLLESLDIDWGDDEDAFIEREIQRVWDTYSKRSKPKGRQ